MIVEGNGPSAEVSNDSTASESTGNVESAPQSSEGAPDANTPPPPYQADYSFQVKNARHEFDDLLRPLITSKEVEDKIRELYTRGHGLEEIKTARELAESRANDFEGKYSTAEKNFKRFWALREHDLGEFFKAAQIPEDAVLDFVRRKFDPEYASHPAVQEQDKLRSDSLQRRFANEDLQEKLSGYETQLSESEKRYNALELRVELQRPDVKSFADRWNQVNPTQPFESLIGAYQEMSKSRGQNVSSAEAIQQLMASYAPFFSTQQQQAAPSQSQNPPPKPPPNLGAPSQTVPIKRSFESLDELREYRHQLKG